MRHVGESQHEFLMRVMKESGERTAYNRVIDLIYSPKVVPKDADGMIHMQADDLIAMIEKMIPQK